ncbi:19153_t:CDS:2, partial [Funneliformis geosporum]
EFSIPLFKFEFANSGTLTPEELKKIINENEININEDNESFNNKSFEDNMEIQTSTTHKYRL